MDRDDFRPADVKNGRPKAAIAFSETELQAAGVLRTRGATWEMVAELIGRPYSQLKRQIDDGRLDLCPHVIQETPLLSQSDYARMPDRRPWTDAEDDLLADAYGPDAPLPESTRDLAYRLHRPMSSIVRRAAIIGVAADPKGQAPKTAGETAKKAPPRPWTPEEDEKLAEIWPDNSVLAVSRELGREPEDVRRRAARVVRGPSRPVRADGEWWTSTEDALVRDLYPVIGAATLALRLCRSVDAVRRRAKLVCEGAPAAENCPGKVEEKNYFL